MEPSRNPLSDEARKAVDDLAQEICGANGLDAETRIELRGHIEDKIAGYVSGEVRPSEQDAMLLARAHFGDPAMVSNFLARVHGRPVGVTLFRRLATLGLVTLIVKYVVLLIVGIVGWRLLYVPALMQALQYRAPLNDVPMQIVAIAQLLIELLVLAAVLLFLRRYERVRGRPFVRLPLLAVIALPVATICVAAGPLLRDWLEPAALVGLAGPRILGSTHRSTFLLVLFLNSSVWAFIWPGCMFFVWLWWIGPQRKHFRIFLATAGAWLGAMCLAAMPGAVINVAAKPVGPMGMAISGWTHVHDGVGRALDFNLQLLLVVALVYGAWMFVGRRLGRRRGVAAE